MSTAVVIPSIRWLDDGQLDALPDADVLVVEAPGFALQPGQDKRIRLLTLDEQHATLGSAFDVIGHGSSACRNYGTWWAHRAGYDRVITLDDDCWAEPGLVSDYASILSDGCPATMLSPGYSGWVSTLHTAGSEQWYPRGFPHDARLGHRQCEGGTAHVKPVVHVGLWTGDLDIDALDKLAYADRVPLTPQRRIFAPQGFFSVCSMNFGTTREWAPFVYQCPMAVPWDSAEPTCGIGRYEDILGGLITFALARQEDALLTFGTPFVGHAKKDTNLLSHARQENFGNVVIGRVASLVERAAAGDDDPNRFRRARRLLSRLDALASGDSGVARITSHLSDTYLRWLDLFDAP